MARTDASSQIGPGRRGRTRAAGVVATAEPSAAGARQTAPGWKTAPIDDTDVPPERQTDQHLPSPGPVVLHLAVADDWDAARAAGVYEVSTRGRTLAEEGFIHASSDQAQLDGVAGRFYADETRALVVLTIDVARLDSPVVLEPAVAPDPDTRPDAGADARPDAGPGAGTGDAAPERFPHIYGPVPVDAVVDVTVYRGVSG